MFLIEQLCVLKLCFVPVTGVLAATTAPGFVSGGSSGTRDIQGVYFWELRVKCNLFPFGVQENCCHLRSQPAKRRRFMSPYSLLACV